VLLCILLTEGVLKEYQQRLQISSTIAGRCGTALWEFSGNCLE